MTRLNSSFNAQMILLSLGLNLFAPTFAAQTTFEIRVDILFQVVADAGCEAGQDALKGGRSRKTFASPAWPGGVRPVSAFSSTGTGLLGRN